MTRPIRRIVILGGGSAGFISAISLKVRLPDLDVAVVRSKELGIIGVGEGTTVAFPNHLHGNLGVDLAEFHRVAQPTWKLGIRFRRWGPRDHFDYTFRAQVTARWQDLSKPNGYYCAEDFTYADLFPALMSHDKAFARNQYGGPHMSTEVGYHIENARFVEFLETYAARLGVAIADDTVMHVDVAEGGRVEGLRLKSGRSERADLYVDASGFVSAVLGKTLWEPFVSYRSALYCDRAVVGGWDRGAEPIKPYTTAEGMSAGWCWQIDHEHRINRGYVFSTAFQSDASAEAELRRENPKLGPTRFVNFNPGRYERAWVGNVVAIGNACGFVEPLEATSLGVICDEGDTLVKSLIECDRQPTASVIGHYNRRNAIKWDTIRDFLAVHYKFNTAFDTPFWRECREKVELGGAEPVVEHYRENGPGVLSRDMLLDPLNQFGLEGYWSLLIGQGVRWNRSAAVTPEEAGKWARIRQTFKAKGETGVGVAEALATIRSPGFRWPANLYRPQAVNVVT